MMDVAKARKILEEDGKKLTDEEVQQYINTAELFSDIFFDMWHKMSPEERKKWKTKKKVIEANKLKKG